MTNRTLAFALLTVLLVPMSAQAKRSAPVAPIELTRLAKPTFVVKGHGWGHGIGLSQWGAYGFARAGSDYRQILAHYYRGTTLGPAPVRRVRVLLASGAKSVIVSSVASLRVRDANATTYDLAPGRYVLKPGLKLAVKEGEPPRTLAGPLVFIAGAEPLALDDRTYRGTFEVATVAGKLQVINNVGLEQYLYGVVPAEVPHIWPTEALKAQAVVARSYALANLHGGTFDLYADTRSQVYRGIPEEELPTNAAVNATAGQVVLYAGKVATTYYHSTSGGRTAAVEDVWLGSQPVPYLVSVPDPYDTASPYHQWGPEPVKADRLASVLRVKGKLADVQTTLSRSRRVTSVFGLSPFAIGPAVDAGAFRRELGLRSTWFTIGVLALERPAAPVPFGVAYQLRGLGRGVRKVTVEQRVAGEPAWTPLSTVAPGADGVFSLSVKPKAVTLYRLTTEDVVGTTVRIPVAPLVRFSAAPGGTSFRGVVRPALPSAVVQVQRSLGTSWTSVASAPVGDGGRWEAAGTLTPGTYRARVPAAAGFAAGTSRELTVAPA